MGRQLNVQLKKDGQLAARAVAACLDACEGSSVSLIAGFFGFLVVARRLECPASVPPTVLHEARSTQGFQQFVGQIAARCGATRGFEPHESRGSDAAALHHVQEHVCAQVQAPQSQARADD